MVKVGSSKGLPWRSRCCGFSDFAIVVVEEDDGAEGAMMGGKLGEGGSFSIVYEKRKEGEDVRLYFRDETHHTTHEPHPYKSGT